MRSLLLTCFLALTALTAAAAANPPVLPIGAPLPDFKLKGVDDKLPK